MGNEKLKNKKNGNKMVNTNKLSPNKILIIGGALLIVLFIAVLGMKNFAFGATSNSGTNTAGQTTQLQNGEVQNVKLKMVNYGYVMEPSTLKVGVPVRMEVDLNTVVGCARDFTIPTFGVRKYVSEGDNIVEFTSTKTGTFNMACSMNMYRGTFTVVNADGTGANAIVEKASTSGGTCGANGNSGGCGCGMMRR